MHEDVGVFGKNKVFVIAEIGANHEGNVDEAMHLINEAAKTGVDAVKFQTYSADKIIHKSQKDRHSHFKKLELTRDNFVEIAEHAKRTGIMFMSTPFDLDAVDFLDPMVSVFKIASGDITFLQLIKKVAEKNKPIIISTGISTVNEIKMAIDTIKIANADLVKDGKITLLHCTASYPTPIVEANLNSIPFLRNTFNVPVGYSDHTLGSLASVTAVALGASVIEKHFTVDKNHSDFRDHKLSADVEEMKELVKNIRALEKGLGSHEKRVVPSETENAKSMSRCIVARTDINRNDIIDEDSITALRPGTLGIPACKFFDVLDKEAKRDIKAGDIITESDIG